MKSMNQSTNIFTRQLNTMISQNTNQNAHTNYKILPAPSSLYQALLNTQKGLRGGPELTTLIVETSF